ncbi:DUF5091 domain-containing protein [Hamiltosporidium tvaerminnensis]|uniref:DUF5091 domain-containing protein n=2 Tax=Hamiltosporidium TaxID=1176354 RepID=A0A4Q9KT72_9MICR|nr:hypothetical protein LUQ84_003226 [Hamiltosporidium tvaerminnensis]TBT97968.1 DUF5091 domain-containing protein [Hamiltosporidium magnivora]TBU04245.1 DUF5091 domain-containing protein [Hamiltosporidium tvaerminnensis]
MMPPPPPVNEELMRKFQFILDNPSPQTIKSSFLMNSYIRMNMIYMSPISLGRFKYRMESLGLQSIQVNLHGLNFIFNGFNVFFRGSLKIMGSVLGNEKMQGNEKIIENGKILENNKMLGNSKIFCVELDFEPHVTNREGHKILVEIEKYLKGCDTIFFMTYFSDIDSEILHNPLSSGVNFLYRRINRRENS